MPSESIKHCMREKVITVKPEQEITEVIALFAAKGITGAPVVNERGELVGMLSDTDCIAAAIKAGFDPAWRGVVSSFMTRDVETVSDTHSIMDVAQRFMKHRFRRYPVVNSEGQLIGQVSRVDVLRGLSKISRGYA